MNPRSMSASLGPTPPRGDDFPCDDGEPMETSRHRAQMNRLVDSLAEAWAARDDFAVEGNMGLYFSETQALKNDFRAPDVFVVVDVPRRERKRWVVWEEQGRAPDVVIELVSESTEHVDRGTKKDMYARVLRVPVYVIYDPFSTRLDAYRLVGRAYEAIDPDEHGRVFCEPLGIFLGVVHGVKHGIESPWLRWIDRDGNVLLEDSERAREHLARARREAHRASDAEAEIDRLREELARRPK